MLTRSSQIPYLVRHVLGIFLVYEITRTRVLLLLRAVCCAGPWFSSMELTGGELWWRPVLACISFRVSPSRATQSVTETRELRQLRLQGGREGWVMLMCVMSGCCCVFRINCFVSSSKKKERVFFYQTRDHSFLSFSLLFRASPNRFPPSSRYLLDLAPYESKDFSVLPASRSSGPPRKGVMPVCPAPPPSPLAARSGSSQTRRPEK